ncbi:DnaJ domain-containing protein [Pontibacter qinzhouensis]|uniref:DnaJ domain-containing protein n=1 Tax=Pontibacter qinzhouensis TaxID=2603253 RepID=UPI00164F9938|nr:DnaJ domain-containing protein [Pontibacter qinzhouensis]
MTKNYYLLLGIQETASQLEIKDAYRKLSKKIHPDLNQGERFFENYFKEIQEAYAILSNNEKKRSYDTRRFNPSEFSTNPASKHLQFQISRLELKINEQEQLISSIQEEKKALNQEMEYFIKNLFEVKTDRNALKTRVQELEQEIAAIQRNSPKEEAGSGLAQQLQQKLQVLELETENYKNGLKNKIAELEQAAKQHQVAIKLKADELTAISAQKQQLEQQLHDRELQDTSRDLLVKSQLETAEKESKTEQARLAQIIQKLELEISSQQATLLNKEQALTDAASTNTDLHQKIETLEQDLAAEQGKMQHNLQEMLIADPEAHQAHVLQATIANLEAEAKKRTQQLQDESQLNLTLQNRVQQLEAEALLQGTDVERQRTELAAAAALQEELQLKAQQLTQEAEELQLQLQLQAEELEEQQKQQLQLRKQVEALELEVDSQKSIIQLKVAELEQEANAGKELQKKAKDLTNQAAASNKALQEKELQLTQLGEQLQIMEAAVAHKQVLQQKLQEMELQNSSQQEALNHKTNDLELLAKNLQEQQRRVQQLKSLQASQQQKDQALTQELAIANAKFMHLARLQPFMIEKLDFFNSNKPEEFSDTFYKQDIKYIFSRLKVHMLAEKPGTLNVLVKYMKPGGELYFNPKSSPTGYSFAATISYSPQEQYINLAGWGSDRESTFVPGDHRVEIYTEQGRQLGKANFMVKEKLLNMSKLKSFF